MARISAGALRAVTSAMRIGLCGASVDWLGNLACNLDNLIKKSAYGPFQSANLPFRFLVHEKHTNLLA